jgi:hypothetical protein
MMGLELHLHFLYPVHKVQPVRQRFRNLLQQHILILQKMLQIWFAAEVKAPFLRIDVTAVISSLPTTGMFIGIFNIIAVYN